MITIAISVGMSTLPRRWAGCDADIGQRDCRSPASLAGVTRSRGFGARAPRAAAAAPAGRASASLRQVSPPHGETRRPDSCSAPRRACRKCTWGNITPLSPIPHDASLDEKPRRSRRPQRGRRKHLECSWARAREQTDKSLWGYGRIISLAGVWLLHEILIPVPETA